MSLSFQYTVSPSFWKQPIIQSKEKSHISNSPPHPQLSKKKKDWDLSRRYVKVSPTVPRGGKKKF